MAYGVYYYWDKAKILESIKKELKSEDWLKYYLNYYIDDTHVNIIVPTELSDYSIIKVKRTDKSGAATLAPTVSEKELTLMQKVLFNQAEFYGNVDPYEQEFGWHKVEEIYGYEWNTPQFGIVDFNKDGKDEVYVYYGDALILHEEDGVIYGYCMPYRGLLRVCTNGTFEGSSGASNGTRTLNVVFNKSEMQYDYISFEGSYDTNTVIYTKGTSIRNEKEWYAKNEVEITEAEYQALMSRYPQGEDNPEYLLTMENILKYVK